MNFDTEAKRGLEAAREIIFFSPSNGWRGPMHKRSHLIRPSWIKPKCLVSPLFFFSFSIVRQGLSGQWREAAMRSCSPSRLAKGGTYMLCSSVKKKKGKRKKEKKRKKKREKTGREFCHNLSHHVSPSVFWPLPVQRSNDEREKVRFWCADAGSTR